MDNKKNSPSTSFKSVTISSYGFLSCFCTINLHDAILFSLYWITTSLLVSGPFVAHHQEVISVFVANGICFSAKWTVGRPTRLQARRQSS
jgi:hypothetical protein